MRTIEVKLYQYDELPTEDAKEKARDWYAQGIETEFWSEYTLEDAKTIGLNIKEFDLDRGSYVKGEFMASAEETAHKIEKEHGDTCETYQDAVNYLKERDEIVNTAGKDSDGEYTNEYELDQKLEEVDTEFLRTLCEDYRIILTKEMEYQYSTESIEENIRCNEYEFTEDGKRA